MPRERIERASNLKVITSTGVGVDSIDVDAAIDYGMLVCNNLEANTRAVAEYTIASIMAVRRRLLQADRDVRDGTWDKFGYAGPELDGQVTGVVGYGAIGRTVLELARGLGMRAVAFDPYVDEESFGEDVRSVGDVGELSELSDAVGIHAPLTDETRGMVGGAELRALGADGILVNAARGGIVDQDALVAALREDAIWGAGLDVFEAEPVSEDSPMLELDNVVVSPHMAGSTRESIPAKHCGAVANVRTVHDGGVPESTLNRDDLCLRAALGKSD